MGAEYYYDQMLPTPDKIEENDSGNKRQLEVWRTGYKAFISIGILNAESSGDRYTIVLSCEELKKVRDAINEVFDYFGCE